MYGGEKDPDVETIFYRIDNGTYMRKLLIYLDILQDIIAYPIIALIMQEILKH